MYVCYRNFHFHFPYTNSIVPLISVVALLGVGEIFCSKKKKKINKNTFTQSSEKNSWEISEDEVLKHDKPLLFNLRVARTSFKS